MALYLVHKKEHSPLSPLLILRTLIFCIMPIETAAISQPRLAHTASRELNDFNQPSASRPSSEAQQQPKPVIPKVQLLAAGFSFFCAGVDGATLGPLLPYIIQSFTINAGEVAIMYVPNTYFPRVNTHSVYVVMHVSLQDGSSPQSPISFLPLNSHSQRS
jgi:hypothetical protein